MNTRLGVIYAPPGGLPESKAQWSKLEFGLQRVLAEFSASLSLKLFVGKMGTRGLLTIAVIMSKIIEKLAKWVVPRKLSIKRHFCIGIIYS